VTKEKAIVSGIEIGVEFDPSHDGILTIQQRMAPPSHRVDEVDVGFADVPAFIDAVRTVAGLTGGAWRMDTSGAMSPPHWRFYRGDEDLPRFTVGELTEGAAVLVLDALRFYERAVIDLDVQPADVEPAWDAEQGVPA
jgi:hypothetical protein